MRKLLNFWGIVCNSCILAVAALLLASCSDRINEAVSYFKVETPRPFGYVIGDEIPQRIIIETRPGITLQVNNLPAKGQINRWLDLNQVTLKQSKSSAGQLYEIELRYQVFYAPLEVKLLKLPGFNVQLAQGSQSIIQTVPDWSFNISPLRELAIRKSDNGEYMRPDAMPLLLSYSESAYGLYASLTIALLTGTYISFLYGCFPWILQRNLFKQALHKLERLSASDMEQALTILHQTFNSLNQQPLFRNQLSDFYRRFPQYRPINLQLDWFFNYSNRYFFTDDKAVNVQDMSLIKDLCLQCRKIERGSQ